MRGLFVSRALRSVAVALLAVAFGGCGAAGPGKTPAASGVDALIAALSSDDPRRAYDLLSEDVRRTIGYREFAAQWKQTAAERSWQTAALRASLRGAPNVGERAVVQVAEGKSVPLERDGEVWRLEVPLVTGIQTTHPRDAIRLFATALAERDVRGALALLTKRRQDGLARQIEGLIHGLGKHLDQPIDEFDDGRAELRWDEDGFRFRILLRRERDEWRIDDLSIRPVPGGDDAIVDDDDE